MKKNKFPRNVEVGLTKEDMEVEFDETKLDKDIEPIVRLWWQVSLV